MRDQKQIIEIIRSMKRYRRVIVWGMLGKAGLNLSTGRLDVIYNWMVKNPDSWRVVSYGDEFEILFSKTPFHPNYWRTESDLQDVLETLMSDDSPNCVSKRIDEEELNRIKLTYVTEE